MDNAKILELKKKFDGWDKGIHTEPSGIDIKEKRPVIVYRVHTGGYDGGNCWDDTEAEYYKADEDNWKEFLLEILFSIKSHITFEEYKQCLKKAYSSESTVPEYYGNSKDYITHWIAVEDVCKILNVNYQYNG